MGLFHRSAVQMTPLTS